MAAAVVAAAVVAVAALALELQARLAHMQRLDGPPVPVQLVGVAGICFVEGSWEVKPPSRGSRRT